MEQEPGDSRDVPSPKAERMRGGRVTEMRRRNEKTHRVCLAEGGFLVRDTQPAGGSLAVWKPEGKSLAPPSPPLPLICFWGSPGAGANWKPEGSSVLWAIQWSPAAKHRVQKSGGWVSLQHMCCPATSFLHLTIYCEYIVILKMTL